MLIFKKFLLLTFFIFGLILTYKMYIIFESVVFNKQVTGSLKLIWFKYTVLSKWPA